MLGKIEGREESGVTGDDRVGWHHQLNAPKCEKIPGDSEGQGSLACCSPYGCKELDITKQLTNKYIGLAKELVWVFL